MQALIFMPEWTSDFLTFWEKGVYSQLIILVDENTEKHCLPILLNNIPSTISTQCIQIPAGEAHKNIHSCMHIWNALSEGHADRNALLVNVGGGVVTDIGGFAASTYLRGIDFVNFPTSLLAMIDASVGGKTGIDWNELKNRIGTFAEATEVYIYPHFLQTLAQNEILSGFAEMLKHGLIADKNHFYQLNALNQINPQSISKFIQQSIEIKSKIVSADPKEKGLRKILNFGHTIGHAIESFHLQQGNPILHGFAVAIGIYYESALSNSLGMLNDLDLEKVQKAISKRYLIPSYNKEETDALIQLMYSDKKNEKGQLSFALIDKIGHCQYNIFVSEKDIQAVLNT